MWLSSVVLALTVTVAMSQHHVTQPCHYPSQFTADVHTFLYGKNTAARGQVVYDAQNERVFTQENYRASGGSAHHGHAGFQILTLFQERMSYVTSMADNSCTIHQLKPMDKFIPHGIPKNATFHTQVTTGVYPTAFNLNEFGLAATASDGKETDTRYQVTSDQCMPTTLVQFVRNPDGSMDLNTSITQNWYDVVLGVADPSVFVPAANCKPAPPPSPSPSPSSPQW